MPQEYALYRNKNDVAIEFSRKRDYKRSTSKMFVILIVLGKIKQTKSIVRIQSALCEDVCKQNSRGLKFFTTQI